MHSGSTQKLLLLLLLLCADIQVLFDFLSQHEVYSRFRNYTKLFLCVFIVEKKCQMITLSGGSLGSCDEEEQSQPCVVMWIAERFEHRPLERILRSQDSSWGHVCPSFGTIYHLVSKRWLEGLHVYMVSMQFIVRVLIVYAPWRCLNAVPHADNFESLPLWAIHFAWDSYFTVCETTGHNCSVVFIGFIVSKMSLWCSLWVAVNGTVVCCESQGQSQLVAAW